MVPKLFYFDFPGRAESIRLIFTFGGVNFEDVRFKREDWAMLKPKTPFGQVPAIEVDGVWIAQSHSLERYAASLAGLLPSEPLKAAIAEQALFALDDTFQLFTPTYKLDAEAKVAARQQLLKGAFGQKLTQISNLLEGKKFLLGDELSYVDFALFASLSPLRASWLDGIPATFLDDFPALKAHHAAVASLDKVKAYYAGKTGLYTGFQVDV